MEEVRQRMLEDFGQFAEDQQHRSSWMLNLSLVGLIIILSSAFLWGCWCFLIRANMKGRNRNSALTAATTPIIRPEKT